MRHAWPWVVLLWLVAWCCWPLLTSPDRLFIGRISTDAAVTLWFYDLIARSGELPHTLTDFDFPSPWLRGQEFPSAVDAALVAPIGRWVDWPGRWGVIQTVVIAVNALGAGILARAVGCRGVAVVAAGGIALLSRQLWFDLVAARMNAAWPGLAAGALGLWLLSLTPQRSVLTRLLLVCAGAWLGALAGAVYPPYLVMMAPAGLALAAALPGRWRWSRLLWGIAPVGLALVWISGDLAEMIALRGVRVLSPLACPDAVHALDATWLARPDPGGLSLPGVGLASWLLVPLALLHPMRRAALVVAGVAAALMALSMGPCPGWDGEAWAAWRTLEAEALWRPLERLTDYGRLASGAVVLLALLSGLGVDALRRVWAPLGGLAAAGCLAWGADQLMTEIRQPDKWHQLTVPPAAEFLADAPPGPVVELPFDRAQQFLSVIAVPDRPRVNPLKAGPRLQSNPFISWLLQLGRGELTAGDFDADDVHHSGLRFILLEPERCAQGSVARSACSDAAIALLVERFGEAESELGGRLLVWSLEGLPEPGL